LILAVPLALCLAACGSSSGSSGGQGQTSSGDQAAQADLDTALRAVQTQYQQTHDFSQAAPAELQQFSRSITWLAPDADAVPSSHQVGVSNGGDNTNQTVTLAAVSTTGTCWYLVDVASSRSETFTNGVGIESAGVWYGHQDGAATICNAPDNGPPDGSTLSGGWSKAHF
jgi:hypothetical protein